MPYRQAERKSDDTFFDRKGTRQNQGKYEHKTLQQASSVKLKEPGEGEQRGKIKRTKIMARSGPLKPWLLGIPHTHPCSACFAP